MWSLSGVVVVVVLSFLCASERAMERAMERASERAMERTRDVSFIVGGGTTPDRWFPGRERATLFV